MKKYFAAFFLAFVLGASVVFGAADSAIDVVRTLRPSWFQGGLYVGSTSKNPASDTKHKITYSLTGSATVDFAALEATDCVDSSAITITGAALGDTCELGASVAQPSDGNLTCYVSAANAVKVRACAHLRDGGTFNPSSASYTVRVFSNQ